MTRFSKPARRSPSGRMLLNTTAGRVVFNSILPEGLRRAGFENRVMRKRDLSELVFESYRRAGLASTVQFLDSLKEFGFRYATMGGVSIVAYRNPHSLSESRNCTVLA